MALEDVVQYKLNLDALSRKKVPLLLPAASPAVTGGTWETFLTLVGVGKHRYQRQILRHLKEAGALGVTREELGEKMAVTPKGVGGAVSGLSKLAKRAGIETRQLVKPFAGAYFAGPLLLGNDLPTSWEV